MFPPVGVNQGFCAGCHTLSTRFTHEHASVPRLALRHRIVLEFGMQSAITWAAKSSQINFQPAVPIRRLKSTILHSICSVSGDGYSGYLPARLVSTFARLALHMCTRGRARLCTRGVRRCIGVYNDNLNVIVSTPAGVRLRAHLRPRHFHYIFNHDIRVHPGCKRRDAGLLHIPLLIGG